MSDGLVLKIAAYFGYVLRHNGQWLRLHEKNTILPEAQYSSSQIFKKEEMRKSVYLVHYVIGLSPLQIVLLYMYMKI